MADIKKELSFFAKLGTITFHLHVSTKHTLIVSSHKYKSSMGNLQQKVMRRRTLSYDIFVNQVLAAEQI